MVKVINLSYIPDSLSHLSTNKMLDVVKHLGINQIEFTTGGWSNAVHFPLKQILANKKYRNDFLAHLKSREMTISALNCSGNHLAYKKDMETVTNTFKVAELLEIDKIIMMSGLPSGCIGDKTPVWVTTSWPPETQSILKYQWEEVAFPVWESLAKQAKAHGIKKIALENHGSQLVYNPTTMFKLRNEIGNIIGMNLDPSHLFWMNGNPIAALRELGDALYHIHAKDSRIEQRLCDVNGVLDTQPIGSFANRTWNYVAVGHGHDLQWWKEFFSTARMIGYKGSVSLEMEDLTMPPLDGVRKSVQTLFECL